MDSYLGKDYSGTFTCFVFLIEDVWGIHVTAFCVCITHSCNLPVYAVCVQYKSNPELY